MIDWSKVGKIVALVLASLVLVNLGFLNFSVFLKKQPDSFLPPSPTIIQEDTVAEATCPVDCLTTIEEATGKAITPAPVIENQASQPAVKEIYIPLGSGSTSSQDWEELAGVEAVIDSANYPNIKEVIFEAVLRIPSANGRVYAKLYDVTSKHDVWFSEVSAEGPTAYRAESAAIVLSSGRNLYRVKMKTTMSYQSILDSARIKIVLN